MTELKTQKPREERKRTKKVFASLAAVTMVGVAGVAGTTAALTATTENEGNEFNAAYIALTDNDAGAFLYNVDNALPGAFVERCILISYEGSAPADRKLYMDDATLDAGAPNVNLTITTGTGGAFPNCTGFTPDASTPVTTTLDAFETSYPDYANGLLFGSVVDGQSVAYRIRAELDAGATPDDTDYLSGVHTYTWAVDQGF